MLSRVWGSVPRGSDVRALMGQGIYSQLALMLSRVWGSVPRGSDVRALMDQDEDNMKGTLKGVSVLFEGCFWQK
jgi:hypothetical protein